MYKEDIDDFNKKKNKLKIQPKMFFYLSMFRQSLTIKEK